MKTTAKPSDTVRIYLQEISRYPLLTVEEEQELGRRVQLMMNPPEGTSPQELARINEQGQRAKDKMVRSNLKLVVAVAKNYLRRNMDLLDLIQEGSIGLARGVEKFDPGRGYKLSTYCYWWIRQSVVRAIAEKSRTIRLPIHINERLNLVKKRNRELSQRLGRTPTLVELASAVGVNTEQVAWWLQLSRHTSSSSVMVGSDDDTELVDLFESDLPTPDDLLDIESDGAYLQNLLLANCTDQEQKVIVLRFGLDNDTPLPWSKVGDEMGLSRERVRQIQDVALKRIRKSAEARGNFRYKHAE